MARVSASATAWRAYRRDFTRRPASRPLGNGGAARGRCDLAMATNRLPLAGVRVLDFTWVVAGPVATRILADQGAEVVKVERKVPPPLGDRKRGLQCDLHRDKLSVAINMGHPDGLELARK